jgi:hypothetical protein
MDAGPGMTWRQASGMRRRPAERSSPPAPSFASSTASLSGKFGGQLARHSSTYAGTGTLRVSW